MPWWLSLVFCLAQDADSQVKMQKVDEELGPWTKISVDGRVIELIHGEHFDDILKDAPDSARPPSLIYFHDSTAPRPQGALSIEQYIQIATDGSLPERDQLFMAQHDVGVAPKRMWFHLTPERNLTHRFLRTLGVFELPVFVYLPRECSGWTVWCDPGGALRIVGGECYKEACSGWEAVQADSDGEWVKTVKQKLHDQRDPPRLYEELNHMKEQEFYLRSRDTVTTREHVNLLQQPRSLPRFTKMGFKMLKVEPELQDSLVEFYHANKNTAFRESWNTWGQTQLNAHETHAEMIDIKRRAIRGASYDNKVLEVMKPILEKWVGVQLDFTSLYGMRQYTHPAALRNHLDRPDVLVVSATFSVYQEGFNHSDWPLQVISFDGHTYRYDHPMGSVMLYESATVSHGKPSKLPHGGLHVGLFLHYRPANWASNEFLALAERRSGKSLRIDRDPRRPAGSKQEGWPQHYYKYSGQDSDLDEGKRQVIVNVCGDPADQRNDSIALGFALLDACKVAGNQQRVLSLLDGGADVDFADNNGWRPIHEAARAGQLTTVKLLAERGADTLATTRGGETALDLAIQSHAHDKELQLALGAGFSGREL